MGEYNEIIWMDHSGTAPGLPARGRGALRRLSSGVIGIYAYLLLKLGTESGTVKVDQRNTNGMKKCRSGSLRFSISKGGDGVVFPTALGGF